ncbi:MAG: restriction endonuclease [Chloroflexi bacterium]|nr:MAG: restriction endonuclease [Chloroflexota bacterium]TMC58717.1 MAG: restriction endonuclease [Chloroflexota bacterium]
MLHSPPSNPDIKRELKNQLLNMSPRGFELFAGEFLVYVGLEKVSVTRYIGDGGIDAEGDLIASTFRIPVGVQVKRYRKNVQRTDIDKFIGALSGRFSEGLFVTTANYGATASKKASVNIPRILTLNGDQVTSIMLENKLGLQLPRGGSEKLRIDPEYFATFEARKLLLNRKIEESRQAYITDSNDNNPDKINDTNTIDLNPEDDLISINALGYALRIDPNTLRRWIESGKLQVDGSQTIRERSNYFVRRDRIEKIREDLNLQARPISSDQWRQEFLDYTKSRLLSKSYKPVLVKALFKLVDREGKAKMDDIVKEFRAFYVQRAISGSDVEFGVPLLRDPMQASDKELKRLIIQMPLERFRIKNYFEYNEEDDTVQIAPQLWQDLRYYEIIDVLKSADEQITYYYKRGIK